MGAQIAEVLSRMGGYEVNMVDINDDLVRKGFDSIHQRLDRFFVSKGKLTLEEKKNIVNRIKGFSIGKALIREGLSLLKDLSAKGCCLVGHPQYYRKFGFGNVAGLFHEGIPQEVFFALSFDGRFPQGNVTFHEGFKADGQQAHAGDAAAPCS